jgi:hypothetical protein
MSKKLTSGNDALQTNQNPLESIVEIFLNRHKKTRILHQHLISGRGTTGTALQKYKFYEI